MTVLDGGRFRVHMIFVMADQVTPSFATVLSDTRS